MKYWLMKTEPDVFSFDDLLKAPQKTTFWEGVRNYQARNFMRDEFRVGDNALVYHSNTEIPAIFGVAEIVKAAYPDSSALDKKSDYYDEKAKDGANPWVRVDIKAKKRFAVPVSRDALKAQAGLKKMVVLKKGSRLSIQPVSKEEFEIILRLGKPSAV